MQTGYDFRGGRGGGRRGNNMNNNNSHKDYGEQPSVMGGGGGGGGGGGSGVGRSGDTLCVLVTDIRQPVTDDMMFRVFGTISETPRRVRIIPSANPNETVVMAQFNDSFASQRVMAGLNNRKIFNDGNHMSMNYASWDPTPVLPAPQPVYNTPTNAYGGMQQQPPKSVYPQAPLPMPQPSMYMPTPQQQPMGGVQQVGYPQQMGFEPRAKGRGRGDRSGRGRGGRMGFDPMAMNYGQMPYNAMPAMMPMANGGVNNFMTQRPTQNTPTVFVSVTLVPETEPLQSIFTLLEVFGGVVTIRRNHNKKEILTVKMASVPEADAVVEYLRKVPFASGTVSARRFPTYNERTPCTDDGNPLDPATVQYDFTTAIHRSPGQRSKCTVSNVLKVTGCAGYSEADVMTYFTSENFFPDRIIKDEEGAFIVYMADAETAVNLLIKCHKNVCGEERSNVLFVEGPKEKNGANAEGISEVA